MFEHLPNTPATLRRVSQLDNLLQTPPAELVADLKALREERTAIESKEQVLVQLLELLAQKGGSVAEEIAELGSSVAIGPLRNQIIQVLRSKQEEGELVLLPMQVHQELVDRGNKAVKLDNVRVTMTRMAKDQELERPFPDQLLFGLPDAADAFPGGRQAFVLTFGGGAK